MSHSWRTLIFLGIALAVLAAAAVLVSYGSEARAGVVGTPNDSCNKLLVGLDDGSLHRDHQHRNALKTACETTFSSLPKATQTALAKDYLAAQRTYLSNEVVERFADTLHHEAGSYFAARDLQFKANRSDPAGLNRLETLQASAFARDDAIIKTAVNYAEGTLALRAKDVETARTHYAEAIELAEQNNLRRFLPILQLVAGKAEAQMRNFPAAIDYYRGAARTFTPADLHHRGDTLCLYVNSVLVNAPPEYDEFIDSLRSDAAADGEIPFESCVLMSQMARANYSSNLEEANRIGNLLLTRLDGTPMNSARRIVLHLQSQRAYMGAEYATAVDHLSDLLEIAVATDNKNLQSTVHNDLGNVFADLGDHKRAVELYQRAWDLSDKSNVNAGNAAAMISNIAVSLAADDKHTDALPYYMEAAELAETVPGHRVHAYLHYNYAKSLHAAGRADEAMMRASLAATSITPARNPLEAASVNTWLASRYLELSDFDSASAALQVATNILQSKPEDASILENNSTFNHWRIDYHRNMSTLMSEMGNDEASAFHATKALEVSDNRFESEKLRVAANADLQFELQGRERAVNIAQRQTALAQIRLSQARNRSTIGLMALIAATILAALSFQLYRTQRRAYVAQRSLTEVKDIFLKETHHQAKNNLQILTSLFRMDSARIRATETGDGLQAFRKQATDRVVTMALIQDHIFNLGVGEAFDTKPFIEDLIDLIDNGLGGEHVVVNKDIQSIDMDYHLATPLGLIISEILTNAYKHAFSDKSGEISIDFREDAGVGPTLIVSDSGKGFDVDETRDGSKGLNLIELLAEQLSAQCNVETKQGSGTTWNIGPIPTVRTS